jgi:predicted ATPase
MDHATDRGVRALRAVPAPTAGCWQLRLLGGLDARNGDVVLARFPTRPIALLMVRLALAPGRAHAREALAELLWPGAAPGLGRSRLRHALSTLRVLLEPIGVLPGTTMQIDRDNVRLNAASVATDVAEFERCVRAGLHDDARTLYRGELLPGFYDDWVLEERERLAALHGSLAAPAGAAAALAGAPASATAAPAADGLPAYLTTFFGRTPDIEQLAHTLGRHRLVTLSGPGGSGKTRLCVETARGLDTFETIAFVALAECFDGGQLLDHVRAALDLPAGATAPLEQLVACLSGRRALLILDNFEQLVGERSDAVVTALLARLPRLHIVLTSRRALQRGDEREIVLAPLPVPGEDDDLVALSRNPGIALFADRARAVRADFHLGANNVAALADLCRALEGLPLAIEIAASRVRAFSPREMCDALRQGIAVLARTGPRAARDGRHASLTAAIGWSWGLLDARSQGLLASLTVFRGGWTATSARAVAAMDDSQDLLEGLVADSLVHTVHGDDGGARFGMLETVREFVRKTLLPAEAATLRARHRAHALAVATAQSARPQGIDTAELPNFIEALAPASSDEDPAAAVALALALRSHWLSHGVPPAALDALRHLVRARPAPDGLGRVSTMLARLLLQAGHPEEALQVAQAAESLAGDDTGERADAVLTQASVRWDWHRDGAPVLVPAREALALAREGGALDTQARALLLLAAVTLRHLRDPETAVGMYDEAQALFAQLGDRRGALTVVPGRVACLQALQRHGEAVAQAVAGEQEAARLPDVETQLLLLNRLSLSHDKLHRPDDAIDVCRRQVRIARRLGMVYLAAYALWNQCGPMARLGRLREATALMAFSQRYWVAQFGPLGRGDERQIAVLRRFVVRRAGAAAWAAWWSEGLALGDREGLDRGCGNGC